MFNPSRFGRSAIAGALACALLAATTGSAAATAPTEADIAAALAQERYYDPSAQHQSSRTRSDDSPRRSLGAGLPVVPAAQAQERYYSSYGEPEPITAPASPPPANGTPGLAIALAATVALAAASIAAIHRRRLRLRRRLATT